jgi:O-antigen chain-terminating methyltransferase
MADEKEHPALQPLRRRLEEEEAAYADALAALDRLAAFSLPDETAPEVRGDLGEMNALWSAPSRPEGGGLGGALRRRAWDALSPVIERQERFNAALVRLLNAHLDRTARLHASLRELAEALVHYAQRVEPVMDARDRMRVALAPTRADLILEAFDRRLEAMGQRLDGLVALRDRMEVVSEEVRALRASLRTAAPAPEVARSVAGAAADSVYTAFENRFRGSREEIRARQADYVTLFRDLAPVVDLGCGRGEFLELLRGAGVQARGVESNANVVRECRERGLDVVQGDLLDHLREEEPGSLGGVFAAQVVEHLPPPVLSALLREAHRVLRPDGLLVLETVNPASALAFLDVFIRDLTHERPLHPETLRFLAAAAGFSEVRIEMRSPVPADVRLHLLPSSGLPPPVIKALNENVERLNALLFAPLDYALLARR